MYTMRRSRQVNRNSSRGGVMKSGKVLLLVAATVAVLVWVAPTALRGQGGPKIRTLTEQEMLDMQQGSSIQGSRRSNTSQLVQRVKDRLAAGDKFTMVSLDDVPDNWTVAVPAGVGGGGAMEVVRERTMQQKPATMPDATAPWS